MHLTRLNVNQVAGFQVVHLAVHHNVNLAVQNEEVFLHHVVIMGLKIFPGAELHQGKIHARAFHQIFGAAVTKAVFLFILIHNEH